MAYERELKKSAKWLVSIQNEDGGWGLTEGQASSLVNTSEALFILANYKGLYTTEIETGLQFIRSNVWDHLQMRGKKTRFVAFPLYILSRKFPAFDIALTQTLYEWLVSHRNEDGGWSAIQGEGECSDIYSTYLVLQSLSEYDSSRKDLNLEATANWVKANFDGIGWKFSEDGSTSYSATAYALMALSLANAKDCSQTESGLSFLHTINHWGDEDATLAGTIWRHSTHSAVISAVALYDQDIFNNTIAQGIRYSNKLISRKGGWMETEDNLENRSVRSQYWAAHYSSIIIPLFDPSKHILRIDSERQEKTLKQPEFQHFLIDTPFATVVPTKLLRWGSFGVMSLGSLFAIGLLPTSLPTSFNVYKVIGMLMIAASIGVMLKRRNVFPKVATVFGSLVIVAGLLNLLFGWSAEDYIDLFRALLIQIGDLLQSIGNE